LRNTTTQRPDFSFAILENIQAKVIYPTASHKSGIVDPISLGITRGLAMKLLTKFNIILIVLFAVGGAIVAESMSRFLFDNAQREVLDQAKLMMASATSVRDYTSSDVGPLLKHNPEHTKRFLPETVPAFGAVTTFNRLRRNYPDYTYREATLNPTNPEDRALGWEADIISYLRDHPEKKEVSGPRNTPLGRSMYLARPIVADTSCMQCHSTAAAAPSAMIATYGSNNGFGWKSGSIVGAQIVSVPMSLPLDKANQAFHLLLTYLVITLVVTIVVLDTAVYLIVIRPLKFVSEAADRVSKGDMNAPPVPIKGNDEIAAVTASFNRMQLSLVKAFKMLG
jgi:HAMP domain-containing protein